MHTIASPARCVQAAVVSAGMLAIAAPASSEASACRDIDHTHATWTNLLAEFTADGFVSYSKLKTNPQPLKTYLTELEHACADHYAAWNRDQQLAFLLNAYNAYTVKLIVDNYPLRSIRSIGLLPNSAFRKNFIPLRALQDKPISLDDIEHNIIRKHFSESRIHFALVCAAKSCPTLRREAYRADGLAKQLDSQLREFLADSTKNRYDAATHHLHLSAIFKWFKDDFLRDAPTLAAYVAPHLPKTASKQLHKAGIGKIKLSFVDYDWSLNEQQAAR